MFDNKGFIEFLEKWGSILKASDVTNEVLQNIAEKLDHVYDMNKIELEAFLSSINLWDRRYMGIGRKLESEQMANLSKEWWNEENQNREQPVTN